MRFLERYPAYVDWRQRSAGIKRVEGAHEAGPPAEDQTPEEQIDASHAALTSALQSDVLERVREMSPAFFERLIVDLLIAMGYGGGRAEMGQAIGKSGDGGIDGMIKEDALRLDIVYIQASDTLTATRSGAPRCRALLAVWMAWGQRRESSSALPPSAKRLATRSVGSASAFVLIDGAELARLMVQHNVGARVRTTYEIKKVDEDYFTE